MKPPRISVAMPVFNCERYVAQSIESLLGQTFGDLELVISDNASSDGTEEICRRFASTDPRVRYIRRATNIGGPANFSYVFTQCRAAYVKWSTADDYWHPEFLAKAIAVLDERPDVVLCYPHTRLVDENGIALSDYDDDLHLMDESPLLRFRQLCWRMRLCHAQLGLARREVMATTKLMAQHWPSDSDFLGEMALRGKIYLLPEIMFFRRFHPGSSSWNRADGEHQRKFFAPGRSSGTGMQAAKRLRFRFGMIWRSPINVRDKLALMRDELKSGFYARKEIYLELVHEVERLRGKGQREHAR